MRRRCCASGEVNFKGDECDPRDKMYVSLRSPWSHKSPSSPWSPFCPLSPFYAIIAALMEQQDASLNIVEIFESVQGETSLTGLPTTFIRLAACNLRCSWCDTPYSFGRGEPYTLTQLLKQADTFGHRYVCVTGGEPLLQKNVHSLMTQLCDRGYQVSLETGGSLTTAQVDPRVRVILDVKCPGSGMSHKNYWPNLPLLRPHDEVKFVLANAEDYLYTKEICEKYRLYERGMPVLLSPVHNVLDSKELVGWMLRDRLQGVRLNLQAHKYIWSPTTRGV